jgi:hypothetical protein
LAAVVHPFGAIADASSRQRRRWLAGGLAILLAAGGLGAYELVAQSRSTQVAPVYVFLTHGATPIQQDGIITAAARAARFAELTRRYPKLAKGLPYNPLSTRFSFDVKRSDLDSTEHALRRLPGVLRVTDH